VCVTCPHPTTVAQQCDSLHMCGAQAQATQSSGVKVKGEVGVSNSSMAARLHALDLVRAF
jgi:hypothetical protein